MIDISQIEIRISVNNNSELPELFSEELIQKHINNNPHLKYLLIHNLIDEFTIGNCILGFPKNYSSGGIRMYSDFSDRLYLIIEYVDQW